MSIYNRSFFIDLKRKKERPWPLKYRGTSITDALKQKKKVRKQYDVFNRISRGWRDRGRGVEEVKVWMVSASRRGRGWRLPWTNQDLGGCPVSEKLLHSVTHTDVLGRDFHPLQRWADRGGRYPFCITLDILIRMCTHYGAACVYFIIQCSSSVVRPCQQGSLKCLPHSRTPDYSSTARSPFRK